MQTQLTQEWRNIIDEIEQQDRVLEVDNKIQRLNWDIAEALSRIQEKVPSLRPRTPSLLRATSGGARALITYWSLWSPAAGIDQ